MSDVPISFYIGTVLNVILEGQSVQLEDNGSKAGDRRECTLPPIRRRFRISESCQFWLRLSGDGCSKGVD